MATRLRRGTTDCAARKVEGASVAGGGPEEWGRRARALFFFVYELLPVYTSGKERLRPDRRSGRGRRRLLAEGGTKAADYARWRLVWLLGPGRWGKRGRKDGD